MTRDQWHRIKEVFTKASRLGGSQRDAYLKATCRDEDTLRHEVESLLAQHDKPGNFMGVYSSIGDKILSHYQILERIGEGGMGIVYKARDTRLGRFVAIKVLPAWAMGHANYRQRLIEEAKCASALNHPNIVTVHEIAEENGVDFLVMEYVPGKTLDRLIPRKGLSLALTLNYAFQIGDALAAAHAAGILHRDLKPSNVMVTDSGRIKLLDFGLALPLVASGHREAGPARPADQFGTEAYMAPERLRDQPVDPRSDIFSFGLILYQMLAGRHAFGTGTLDQLRRAILNEQPRNLPAKVPTSLRRIIERCLEKQPERRFRSVPDLVIALKAVAHVTPGWSNLARSLPERLGMWTHIQTTGRKKSWPAGRIYQAALLGLAVAATVVVISQVHGGPPTPDPFPSKAWRIRTLVSSREGQGAWLTPWFRVAWRSAPVSRGSQDGVNRWSLAVLGFKNLSGRPDESWISTALAEMFRVQLTATGQLRTIVGEEVARAKAELSLTEADGFAKDTLGRIRKNLRADFVLLGSYLSLGKESKGELRLNLTVQETTSGETIASIFENGRVAELPKLVSDSTTLLREKLRLAELPASEAAAIRATSPRALDAQRLYAQGLEKLRHFDTIGAREDFENVVQVEPNYALGHSALAEAWSVLGYEEKAQKEAKIAFDFSAHLAPEEALAIEANYHELAHQPEEAIQTYRKLSGFFPDNPGYRLRLARAQISAGKGKEALATTEAMRKMPRPLRDDPRIDLTEAIAAESVGDFKREQKAAENAAAKAEAGQARILLANAQLRQCWALNALGQREKAYELAKTAKQTFTILGDRRGKARALRNMADILDDQGNHVEAQELYNAALAIFRENGHQAEVAITLNNLAYAVKSQGDLAGSKKLFDDSLALCRKINNRGCQALPLTGLAILLWRQGDLTGAKTIYEQAWQIHHEVHDKHREAIVLGNIAAVLEDQGFLAEAQKKFEESLTILGEIGDLPGAARTLGNLGELLARKGDLAGAKKRFEEQLAIGRQIHDHTQHTYALQGLGALLMAQGDLSAARQKYEEALALRTTMEEKGLAAETRLAMAELSREEGRLLAAESDAREAASEFKREKEWDQYALANAILAEVLLAQGKASEAQKTIALATERAAKSEDRGVRLRVGIAAARVQAAAGHPAQALMTLQSVAAQAAKHGYTNYEFEARLALGQIERDSGKPKAHAHLEALQKEARAQGFRLIASKSATSR